MNGFRLRSYFLLTILTGVSALVVIGGVLWYQSDRLGEIAHAMQDSVESVTTAQIVRSALDAHRRQALLEGIRDAKTREEARKLEERQIADGLDRSQRWVSSESERLIVARARLEVDAYLADSHHQQKLGATGPALFRATSASYDRAIAAVADLVDINVTQALKTEGSAVADGSRVKHIVASVVLGVFILMTVLIWIFYRFVSQPLSRLHETIESYELTGQNRNPFSAPESPRAVEEVREIGSAFTDLTVRLKRQNEQQLTFVTAVAHDIKNPLGAIEMSLELLAPHDGDQHESSTAERHELVELMHRQVLQLRRLVDDMMDATRIEAGRLELRKVPLHLQACVKDCVQLFAQVSPNHPIEFLGSSLDLPIEGDPQRIGQVVGNLLSNAIKYSPAGGVVRVTLAREGRWAELAISDEGVGIAPSELPTIFEPFRRAQSSREQIVGVGLGLSTSRKLIEAHQGTIQVESELGRGSRFTVRFPLVDAAKMAVSELLADGVGMSL